MRNVAVALAGLFALRCVSGSIDYTPPGPPLSVNANVATYDKKIDDVWKAAISYVADSFFVIDNMEKDSHFLNLSFSASDPTRYVDCGEVSSHVTNARGSRDYNFPASSASQQYEVLSGGNLLFVDRKFTLSGKINVIMSELSPDRTQVKVNTRYVCQIAGTGSTPLNMAPVQHYGSTISFITGELGSGEKIKCRSTLALEHSILDGIKTKM